MSFVSPLPACSCGHPLSQPCLASELTSGLHGPAKAHPQSPPPAFAPWAACAGLVPKQHSPTAPAQAPKQGHHTNVCQLAAEEAITEQLVRGYDAAISYGIMWHCPISQAAAACVQSSPCRWRIALETLAPETQPAEATPEPVTSVPVPKHQPAAPLKPRAPMQQQQQQQQKPKQTRPPSDRGVPIAVQRARQPAQRHQPPQQQQQPESSSHSEQDMLHEQANAAAATNTGDHGKRDMCIASSALSVLTWCPVLASALMQAEQVHHACDILTFHGSQQFSARQHRSIFGHQAIHSRQLPAADTTLSQDVLDVQSTA